ncbi:MAG: class I SAM-dependent methyltransferase, partial [Pseudomonadota bacterium]
MDAVKAQYEAYPYPERDPQDEDTRLITGSPSHLDELRHYVFAGKRPPEPFRALVAGGGTGDGLIMLAEHCRQAGLTAEITYLDLSEQAAAIARARAERRGLTGITFRTGSLLETTSLAGGPFHYIDCCGVLHHLADPPAGLAALRDVLDEQGGMGLMVYAPYGRTGVYPLQEVLRSLTGEMAPREQVAVAKRVIEGLPPTNWFARNGGLADHRNSDAGLYDLLLHSQDRAYSVREFSELLEGA